ncbi:unnamed protein product [Bemisia tabaci]|uniref:Polyprenal reductase n=1 Tax=Bemisia tabaci TaxID=7038 RepID=A0A9P0AIP0_BEMTA|nr:unnamed protein product [Bemisia tabaci]
MELTILKLIFMLMTFFIMFVGGLINSLEKHLPDFILQSFKYGKFAHHVSSPLVKPIEIPKRWFRHFYVFAALFSSIALAISFNVFVFARPIPSWLSFLLDFLGPNSRNATVTASSSLLALFLLTMQSWRRFYETHYISVFSDTNINLSHYLVGYMHYFGAICAILIEAPGFATPSFDYRASLSLSDLSVGSIAGALIFLWAWHHQFKAAIILSKLRKDKKGAVVSYEHKMPKGDLFEVVSSPHFFCEMVMYLALTIILWGHCTWPYVFFWVLCNQLETALLNHWWYKSKFDDYPKQRKAYIPYIL